MCMPLANIAKYSWQETQTSWGWAGTWLYFSFLKIWFLWIQPKNRRKKIIQWSPLWIIFKGKLKIAHLLPQQSVHSDNHFLQTWPLWTKKIFHPQSRFWKWDDCQNHKVVVRTAIPEHENIQFNTILYYLGGATAYLGGTTAYMVGAEIIRIKAKSVQIGWDLNSDCAWQ